MDTVLYGGKVYLVDPAFRTASAIAIRGARIAAVGDDTEILALAGPRTRRVHLQGATVLPGLIDSHVHLVKELDTWGRVDLRGVTSVAEVLDRLRRHAAGLPPGTWVMASPYWHEGYTREGRFPTRAELDAALPDHPVFLPRGMYQSVLNSLGLRLAGIHSGTPDPEHGKIGRDEHGNLTGWLWRSARLPVEKHLPRLTRAEQLSALEHAMKHYNRLGLTSIREAAVTPEEGALFQTLWADRRLTLRVNMLPLVGQPLTGEPVPSSDPIVGYLERSHVRTGFGDAWLRVGSLKMLMDGGIEGAYLREPHVTDPNYRGFLRVTAEMLDDVLDAAARNGWSMAMHVSGDAAMELYLAALEKVAARHDLAPLRWVIEHAFFTTPEQCARIRRLGLRVTIQPALMYDFGDAMVSNWGEQRARSVLAIRDMLGAGLEPGGGSDGPFVNLSPLMGMQVLITRETARAGKFCPQQGVDARTALIMYTRYSAAISGEEHVKGTLEPGKLADLVVLGDDPLTCPPEQISSIPVLMTVVGGREMHRDGI